MDQTDFQQVRWGSAPVLFNQQQGDDQETISLAVAGLAPSPAYTDFEPPRGASLPMIPAYTDFEPPRGASLLMSPAYTDFEQSPSSGLPLSPAYDLSHAALSGFEEAPSSQTNELLLPQPQFDYGHIYENFPNYALLEGFNQTTLPLNHRTNDQNIGQNILPWLQHQSNTVQHSGLRHYDSPNHVLSGFGQVLGVNHAPVTSNSRQKPQRCIRCRILRQKCMINTPSRECRCSQCVRQGIPASVCNQDGVITRIKPFDKCLNHEYKLRFTCVRLIVSSSPKIAQLGHYRNGPILEVKCCEFFATHITQTSVIRKNRSGWHWMPTTAYCLTNAEFDISPYLQKCVRFSKDEACGYPQRPVSFFFEQACLYTDTLIIQQCLEMYTALRLLRIGWQFSGEESLGMATVGEKDSVFYGFKYVPRMVQNQLNYALELKIMELDRQILKGAQNIVENGGRCMWVIGYLVFFFLLHIREVDAGRNIYWSRSYPDLDEFWMHPSKPTILIDELIASCNSILSLFHCSMGRKPLDLNWDDPKSGHMVDNDPKVVNSMKALQTHIFNLRKKGLIGQKACDVFEAGDPNSVNFTISSLLFGSIKDCEVQGFH